MGCERCGGFLVRDYFTGASPYDGFRCINCGALSSLRRISPPPRERQPRRGRTLTPPASADMKAAG